MLIRKALRFRLYPTTDQQVLQARQFGCVRWVYNHFLARRKEHYEATRKGLSYEDTAAELVALKRTEGLEWLREAHSQTLQQGLKDLDAAYQHFFHKRNQYPKFKKRDSQQSCRYPQGVRLEGKGREGRVYLPKIGWLRCVVHREVEGKIKQVTVSKTSAGLYYVSVHVEVKHEVPAPAGDTTGIDLGLTHFATLSNGKQIEPPHYLSKSILDASWSEFVRQLRYKGEWYGCQVIIIDRFYPSSKRCHACGGINHALKLSERVWTCETCGMRHDRDLNAALNILFAATAGTVESYAGVEAQQSTKGRLWLSADAVPHGTLNQTLSAFSR